MVKNKIYGIILAAGYSSRMKRFKPLLEYNGKSFLVNILDKLNLVCDKIIVITGYNSDKINKHISTNVNKKLREKLVVTHNENYDKGMFESLKVGLKKIEEDTWILYHFIDQPLLNKSFYSTLANQIEKGINWIQPTKNHKKGHPILFDYMVAEKILSASDEISLKEISSLSTIKKKYFEVSTENIFANINTLEDYNSLDSTTK